MLANAHTHILPNLLARDGDLKGFYSHIQDHKAPLN